MLSDIMKAMKNDDLPIGYDLNEKDIDGVLHYMELHDPEHASPDRAIRFLVEWKKSLRGRDVTSSTESELKKFYDSFIQEDIKKHK